MVIECSNCGRVHRLEGDPVRCYCGATVYP